MRSQHISGLAHSTRVGPSTALRRVCSARRARATPLSLPARRRAPLAPPRAAPQTTTSTTTVAAGAGAPPADADADAAAAAAAAAASAGRELQAQLRAAYEAGYRAGYLKGVNVTVDVEALPTAPPTGATSTSTSTSSTAAGSKRGGGGGGKGDSVARSVLKGVIWRLFSTTVTVAVALLLLGDAIEVSHGLMGGTARRRRPRSRRFSRSVLGGGTAPAPRRRPAAVTRPAWQLGASLTNRLAIYPRSRRTPSRLAAPSLPPSWCAP